MQSVAKWIGGCASHHYNRSHGVQEHAPDALVHFLRATVERDSLVGRMRKIIEDGRANAAKMQAAARGAAGRRKSAAIAQQAAEVRRQEARPKLRRCCAAWRRGGRASACTRAARHAQRDAARGSFSPPANPYARLAYSLHWPSQACEADFP